MTESELQAAHIHATSNEAALGESDIACCFYCRQIFPASEVKDFLASERTALCPRCGIDSVIGSASGLPITKEFLREMHNYWFIRTVPITAV